MPESASPKTLTDSAVVVERAYEFNLWLLRKVERFPRSFRFSVGDRIVARALDVVEGLTAAAWAREKRVPLERALSDINGLRILLRTATDLGLLKDNAPEFVATKLEEIGRMAGAWRKSLRP